MMKITRSPFLALVLAALGLSCIAARQAWMFRTGLELRLMGEGSPVLMLTVGVWVVLAPYLVCLCSTALIVLTVRRRPLVCLLHVATCVLMVATIWTVRQKTIHSYDAGIIQKLHTADEEAYLTLAKHIHDRAPPGFDTFAISHDVSAPETDYESLQKMKMDRIRALMPDELPAARIWPKEMLNISVDANMIRIDRGSGMLGMIGVVILEKGSRLEEFSAEQLAKSPYLPRYTQIYDRVYYFFSD